MQTLQCALDVFSIGVCFLCPFIEFDRAMCSFGRFFTIITGTGDAGAGAVAAASSSPISKFLHYCSVYYIHVVIF